MRRPVHRFASSRVRGVASSFLPAVLVVLTAVLILGYVQAQWERQRFPGNAHDMVATSAQHRFGVDDTALSPQNAHGTVSQAIRVWLMKASGEFNVETEWTYAASFYGGLFLLLRTALPWFAICLPLLGFMAAFRRQSTA